jgi:hypothetical protein
MVLELRVKKFLGTNQDVIKKKRGFTCSKSPYYVKLPSKESENLFRLMGVIHGDGNMSRKRILITEKDKGHVDTIVSLFENVFAIATNIFYDKRRNSYYCHLKNSIIYRYLVEVLEVPKESVRANLKLPTFMKQLEFVFQKAYVGGLYDAEGWVTKRQAHVGLSISNKEIRDFVSYVLDKCDIKHSVNLRNRRSKMEYEVHVYGKENLKKFQKQISFTHPTKVERMLSFH